MFRRVSAVTFGPDVKLKDTPYKENKSRGSLVCARGTIIEQWKCKKTTSKFIQESKPRQAVADTLEKEVCMAAH